LLFLNGCGYKPASTYAKEAISGNVFVTLKIDLENPENSVMIKDAVDEIIIRQFGGHLVYNKENADSTVNIDIKNVSFDEIQFDTTGYVKTYRATVDIGVKYDGPKQKGDVSVSDFYDFSVDSESIISDERKTQAVKMAANKALTNLFSKIAVQSFKK
jgi:hypothetical protein